MATMRVGAGAGTQSNVYIVYNKLGFLTIARSKLIFEPLTEDATLPTGIGSDTARWHKLADLPLATSPLPEGLNPTEDTIANPTQTDVQIQEFGSFIKVSSKHDLLKPSAIQEQYNSIIGRQGGATINKLIQNEALTTSTIIRAGGQANSSLTGAASGNTTTAGIRDIARIRAYFRSVNSEPHSASAGGKMFILAVDPEVTFDIQTDAAVAAGQGAVNWMDLSKYTQPEAIKNGSVGSIMGVQLFETTEIDTTSDGGQTVFRNIAFADEGIGSLHVGSRSGIRIINKRPGPQDTSNPLDRFQTYGWVAFHADKLLDTNRLLKFYSLA